MEQKIQWIECFSVTDVMQCNHILKSELGATWHDDTTDAFAFQSHAGPLMLIACATLLLSGDVICCMSQRYFL